jgi:hypothetical protein
VLSLVISLITGAFSVPVRAQSYGIDDQLILGIGSAQPCRSEGPTKLALCAGAIIPILVRHEINRHTAAPADSRDLVTFDDVKVGDTVVIRRGTVVRATVNYQNPGWQQKPGILTVDLNAVEAVTGQSVELQGAAESIGITNSNPCRRNVCTTKPPWTHGGNASLKSGTLITALVKKTMQLNTAELEALGDRKTMHPVEAHVFFYPDPNTLDERDIGQGLLGLTVKVTVDGQKMGRMGPQEYACLSVFPGTHRLKVDKTEYLIDADDSRNYFVRVGRDSDEEAQAHAELTEGLEIGLGGVTRAHFPKSARGSCPQ